MAKAKLDPEISGEARNHGGSAGVKEAGTLGLLRSRQAGVALRWSAVPAATVGLLVQAATDSDYTVQFGRTRNGKSLSLRIWQDGEADLYYAASAEEAVDLVRDLLEVLAPLT